jgi:hypothetical protein
MIGPSNGPAYFSPLLHLIGLMGEQPNGTNKLAGPARAHWTIWSQTANNLKWYLHRRSTNLLIPKLGGMLKCITLSFVFILFEHI